MQNNFLKIEVRTNDADQSFETNLLCSVPDCKKTVFIDSQGPKSIQSVSCPKHGFLTSFPHQIALGEFVKFLANKILAANGHELIQAGAVSIFGDNEIPESVN
jgi:hypothetical protein